MNKRVTLLEEIATIAKDLPDEEIRKLESFAGVLRDGYLLRKVALRFLEFKTAILSREFDPGSPTLLELFRDLEEAISEPDPQAPEPSLRIAARLLVKYVKDFPGVRDYIGIALDNLIGGIERSLEEGEPHPWEEE